MKVQTCIGALAVVGLAAPALANVAGINAVQVNNRIFNDFTTTTLNVTNNYPTSYQIQEFGYVDDGIGGNFANKHGAYYSDDGGATAMDFNYDDSFDACLTYVDSSSGIGAVEAGFLLDLFGFGFFGGLPGNGEIAAFGSTIPFHSFGTGLYAPGDTLDLRMIYRAGSGEFVGTSTMQYFYQVNGGGFTASGHIPFTNTEMGIPSGIPESQFIQKIGFGAQMNNPIGGTADVLFSNMKIVPAPGAFALCGLAGLAGLRRRR